MSRGRGPEHDLPPAEEEQMDISVDPLFLQYMEANAGLDLDPLSDDAIRFQAQYVTKVGTHPMDVLKAIVANPFVKPSERVAAAKILLEYGARKVPSTLELDTSKNLPLKITPEMISALSDDEMETLVGLLRKAKKSIGVK
jgi:hypothetical protein